MEASTFVHDERIVMRRERNGAYLFDPDSGNLIFVNLVGASLYDLCDGEHTTAAMQSLLAGEYDVPREQLAADVEQFLSRMVKMALIRKNSRLPQPSHK